MKNKKTIKNNNTLLHNEESFQSLFSSHKKYVYFVVAIMFFVTVILYLYLSYSVTLNLTVVTVFTILM